VRQEVAAVCYRVGGRGIEFLLVQTRGGRWIFPKGGVERGLTTRQSAALEAFEEAGVHGRIEAAAFARYFKSGRIPPFATKNQRADARSAEEESSVSATSAKSPGLNRPRNRTASPPGFPRKKRNNACSRIANRNSEPNLSASSTVLPHASGDCTEARAPKGHTQPAPARKRRCKKFTSMPSKSLAGTAWLPPTPATLTVNTLTIARRQPSVRVPTGHVAIAGRNCLGTQLAAKSAVIDDARPANGSKAPAKSPRSRGQ